MDGDLTDALVEHAASMNASSRTSAVLTMSPAVAPFLAVGVAGVVSGGLIAAASRPAGWERGSWVAAVLVLVVGVGQSGLAVGQATFGTEPTRRVVTCEMLSVNLGAAFVIVGTVLSSPLIATAGSLSFAAALAMFARGAVGRRADGGRLRWAFVALLLVLTVSVPVGVTLTWLRR